MSPSRLGLARPAVRAALPARMLLSGPPGSGKTRTSLIVATELCPEDKGILVIDTEKESAASYSDDFAFDHLRWEPPFDPATLADTVRDAAAVYGVVVIDSLSHFWRGEGGTLDVAGGKFTGWKEARPLQERLVESLVSAPCHVVLCVRAKVEYAQEQEANGKHVVRKLGMASVQDDTLEYEVNVAVEMAMDHTATISKSRTTALPVGRSFRPGDAHKMAAIYRDWLAGGEPLLSEAQARELVGLFDAVADKDARKDLKAAFVATFARPEQLVASRFEEAKAWIAERTAQDLRPEGAARRRREEHAKESDDDEASASDGTGDAPAAAAAGATSDEG